jgi:transcriptional regulator with XRE-family HTH domain
VARKPAEPLRERTLYQVIGSNLRRLRATKDWSQDQLANVARQVGLDWSRSSVAAVEAGKKTLDFTEVLLLAVAVDVGIKELLSGGGTVAIGGTSDLALRDIRSSLASAEPPHKALMNMRRRLLRARGIYVGRDVGIIMEKDQAETLVWIQRVSKGEAEQKAARKLNVPVEVLSECALEIWGRSLTQERDRRISNERTEDPASRSLQASRGHVTRQLLGELADIIGDYNQRIYDESGSN